MGIKRSPPYNGCSFCGNFLPGFQPQRVVHNSLYWWNQCIRTRAIFRVILGSGGTFSGSNVSACCNSSQVSFVLLATLSVFFVSCVCMVLYEFVRNMYAELATMVFQDCIVPNSSPKWNCQTTKKFFRILQAPQRQIQWYTKEVNIPHPGELKPSSEMLSKVNHSEVLHHFGPKQRFYLFDINIYNSADHLVRETFKSTMYEHVFPVDFFSLRSLFFRG